MLLAVDIGNTNVVVGLYDGKTLTDTFRLASARDRTADEYAALLVQLLQMRGFSIDRVSAAILASVVPPLTDSIVQAVRSAFAREPLVVGPGLETGIPVLYENPLEVGADRVVNAVAAYERFREATIVIDLGTATTFDCISPQGEYLGGVILPGVRTGMEALANRAAKLSRVELAAPPRALGRNTTHALQSGLVFGHAAQVDGMVERLEQEAGYTSRVIATGGLGALISKHTKRIEFVDVHLTLEGLRILHDRNSRAPQTP